MNGMVKAVRSGVFQFDRLQASPKDNLTGRCVENDESILSVAFVNARVKAGAA